MLGKGKRGAHCRMPAAERRARQMVLLAGCGRGSSMQLVRYGANCFVSKLQTASATAQPTCSNLRGRAPLPPPLPPERPARLGRHAATSAVPWQL